MTCFQAEVTVLSFFLNHSRFLMSKMGKFSHLLRQKDLLHGKGGEIRSMEYLPPEIQSFRVSHCHPDQAFGKQL